MNKGKRLARPLGLLIAASAVFAAWAQDLDPVEQEGEVMEFIMNQSMIGAVVVSGRVQDAEGHGLNGVDVSVDYATFMEDVVSTMEVVNTTFSFSCSNCSSISLGFDKDGYQRPEDIQVVFEAEILDIDGGTKEATRGLRQVSTNLVVTMTIQDETRDAGIGPEHSGE